MSGDSPRLFGQPLTREHLRERAGGHGHVVGVELVEHVNGPARGVRVAQVRTGEIEFEVVLDRAADLGRATRRGIPIGWLSPTGLVAPGLVERSGWEPLRSFGGGLLTTCGLDHTGAPAAVDASRYRYEGRGSVHQPLHGRLSGTPAELLASGVEWDADTPYAYVEAEVRQVSLFGEHLTLRRSLRAPLGGATIQLRDLVRNDGYAATPLAVLYHVNCGWPLVAPATEIALPRASTTPLGHHEDPHTIPDFEGAERVWRHQPHASGGTVRAAVLNDDLGDGRAAGLLLAYDASTLPYLLQWVARGAGHWVCGLEPANGPADGPEAVEELAPGEERLYELSLTLLAGAGDVDAARTEVAQA